MNKIFKGKWFCLSLLSLFFVSGCLVAYSEYSRGYNDSKKDKSFAPRTSRDPDEYASGYFDCEEEKSKIWDKQLYEWGHRDGQEADPCGLQGLEAYDRGYGAGYLKRWGID